MAERERKSKPRKEEPIEDAPDNYNWWQLAMFLTASIGIILIMVMVSMFLSGGATKIPVWLFYVFGATVVVSGVFWLLSWLSTREK